MGALPSRRAERTERTASGAVGRAWTAFALGALAVGVSLLPSTHLVTRSPGAHLVLETVVTLTAALVALLSYGRFLRSAALRDLLLVHAMALLSVAALVFVTLPWLLGAQDGDRAAAWAALLLRVAGALGLLAASLTVPTTRLTRGRPGRDVGLVAGVIVLITVVAAVLSGRLPDVVRVSRALESSGGPVLSAPPAVLVTQVVTLACFAAAGVAFARRAQRDGDEMLAWFGAAAVLGAWARLSYLLYPSLYSDWLYVGDLLRLGCYLLLVVGAVVEIRTYWQVRTGVAVEAERRRLARDLHDGVVQELGWIRGHAARTPQGRPIAAAADRALFETRRAIAALGSESDEPLRRQVERAALEAADMVDAEVRLDVDPAVDADDEPERREALVRITREAVLNAGRHSGSTEPVLLRLVPGRLAISDTGCGFDPTRDNGRGFGLVGMADRAEAVGARVRVHSTPGGGTTVEVTW